MEAPTVTPPAGTDPVPRADEFERLFDQHPEALLVIDPYADVVVRCNRAATRLLGYSAAQLSHLRASALHGAELAGLIVFTQSVLAQGSGWTSELSCVRPDGTPLPVEYSASRLDYAGTPHLLVTLRDLATVRRRYDDAKAHDFVRRGLSEWRRVEKIFEEIERENQLILKAAGEGIYGVNANGITTFVNPAAERILGWRAHELVGRNAHALIHHSHPDGSHYTETDCPIFAAFRDGAVHHIEDEVFWRKDGSAVFVDYTSTPIRQNGQLLGAVIVFRDISDRKKAEAKLRAALAEVEDLKQKLELENAYLQEEIREEYKHREIVGRSQAVRQVIQRIEMVAPTNANVLITGESGTGKELIARAIHESSARGDRPLIRVNCAAIPRDLFESEFFGHTKGAFTGAINERAGRFELADKGTLFLDEVGDIPLELQSKLLRVLQEGQFERVGEARTRTVDVRVIAATNRDLGADVAAGRFRQDLYFRLNVFPIESVPLRARPEDIPLLASHFLLHACRRLGAEPLRLTQAHVARLQSYDWPGNVRELANVIERAVIVSRNGRLLLDIPQPDRASQRDTAASAGKASPAASTLVTESERHRRDREAIVQALKVCCGKVFGPGGAAELLGVKPTTLASRIKRLGIKK